MCRGRHPLCEPVEFNLHQLCRDLGWSFNGRNYEKSRLSISLLNASEVKVENERIRRETAIFLIREYQIAGLDCMKGTKYRVWIQPNSQHNGST